MVRSALNEDDVNTYSESDAISSSSFLSTPFPTPIAYTVAPVFLIPSDATTRLVYTPVLVCFPSVMTIAICKQEIENCLSILSKARRAFKNLLQDVGRVSSLEPELVS